MPDDGHLAATGSRRRLRDRTKALSKSLSGAFEIETSEPSSRDSDRRGTSLPGKVMEDALIAAVEAPRWSAANWTVDSASRQPGFNGNLINGRQHAGDFEHFGQRGKQRGTHGEDHHGRESIVSSIRRPRTSAKQHAKCGRTQFSAKINSRTRATPPREGSDFGSNA